MCPALSFLRGLPRNEVNTKCGNSLLATRPRYAEALEERKGDIIVRRRSCWAGPEAQLTISRSQGTSTVA